MRRARRKQTQYLWFRDGTPHIWFSRAVPKRLWDTEGKKVIQCSLGTAGRAEARKLARRHSDVLDERWGLVGTPPARSNEIGDHIDLDDYAVAIWFDRASEVLDAKVRNVVDENDELVQAIIEKQRASHQRCPSSEKLRLMAV